MPLLEGRDNNSSESSHVTVFGIKNEITDLSVVILIVTSASHA